MNDLIGKSFGRYHILEQLGEGGMAIVYKAYDTRLETDIAVKVIRTENILPSVLERALKRFEREAKALARLTHPNIVKVTDYGEYEGKPYLVMPYFPGGTLKQKMGKPIPWQEAIQILLPIAEALDYAHSQNMIHRDVKPSNILLTQRGQPMLTDFGIAKVLDLEETMDLTGTNAAVGTPEYMAPEQATAKTVDHRADIYALGIVLYEMVTGRKPYVADTPLAVLFKHASDPLPSPKKYVQNLPDSVEKVLLKALAKKPEDRYQSMGEMAIALAKLQGNRGRQPVTKPKEEKRAPKPASEIKLLIKPNSMMIILGLVVLVLAAIFGLRPLIGQPELTPTITNIASFKTITPIPLSKTKTPTSTFTPTKFVTVTPTPLPTEITNEKGVEMVLVPAGDFIMGSGSSKNTIYIDEYYIDKFEVTNSLYAKCVNDGACEEPKDPTRYANKEYANHPVAYVDWGMSQMFCKWRNGNLPTEAQWEKAARGVDGRKFPWGNQDPNSKFLNYFFLVGDSLPVGSYPSGASPYGAMDMAGNVWEWTNDWFDTTDSTENYVIKGGAWNGMLEYYFHSSYRQSGVEIVNQWFFSLGFRCTRDATP